MPTFNEKLEALIEQRVIEAAKKQVTKKLLCISTNLGKPIISQSFIGNKLYGTGHLQEDLIYDPNRIPIQEPEDWSSVEHGYYFDGLRCGINLCITAMIYDGKVDELKATYNGYLVYGESRGELVAYAPFPTWEDAVDMFYEGALQAEKAKLLKEREEKKEKNRQKMSIFLDKFKSLWGWK